jgi:hypothetical protein
MELRPPRKGLCSFSADLNPRLRIVRVSLLQHLKDTDFYIVPTLLLERAMREESKLQDERRRQMGMESLAERKSRHCALRFTAYPGPFRAYAKRWGRYHEAWHLLEGVEARSLNAAPRLTRQLAFRVFSGIALGYSMKVRLKPRKWRHSENDHHYR